MWRCITHQRFGWKSWLCLQAEVAIKFYEGESIIIRNAVAFVSVGSTVVYACIARRGFLLITAAQVWSCYVSPFVTTVSLNMAGPLFVCTKEEQRSVIRFLWSEAVSGAEIHRRLSAQYRNSVLPQRSVYEWLEKFKNGRTSVTHEVKSQPTTG